MKHLLVGVMAAQLLAQQVGSDMEKERALGEQLASQVRQRSKPLASTPVDEYVKAVATRLSSAASEKQVLLSIETILSDRAEPEVLPGGHLFVPAACLLSAQDESEFAALLGHSIAHVVLGHSAPRGARGQSTALATVPLMFWGPVHAEDQDLPLIPTALMRQHRQNEMEADRLAIQLLSRAGFEPRALRRYVARTQGGKSRVWSAADKEERLAAIDQTLRDGIEARSLEGREQFERVQAVVRSIVDVSRNDRPPTLRRQ
jgi:predicted Zn-dependent protease